MPSAIKDGTTQFAAVRADAFAAACNTKVIRFEQSRRAAAAIRPITRSSASSARRTSTPSIATSEGELPVTPWRKGKAAAGLCNANVDRFEQSRRGWATAQVHARARGRRRTSTPSSAVRDSTRAPGRRRRRGAQRQSTANQREKYFAEKANNGCPGLRATVVPEPGEAPQKPSHNISGAPEGVLIVPRLGVPGFRLQAAPVGKFPTARSVVKNAAKVQDEEGVKFPGRIDVRSLRPGATRRPSPKSAEGRRARRPAKKPKNRIKNFSLFGLAGRRPVPRASGAGNP